MELTKPQTAVLIQFCTSMSNGGVLQGKKPDPRVIRSLLNRGLLSDNGGWYSPTTLGFERIRTLKTRDFREHVRPPQAGSIAEGVGNIVTPRENEKWVMDVAAQIDRDLSDYRSAENKVNKVAAYYSYSARVSTINKYMLSSGRDLMTILQLRKFFSSREPRLL